ncbi:conserved hypothetical protein [Neospora caninum Liverpool]|uniref:protein-disulfide reductase n=1 Tax=Neospora caninum (strain Liverpool) TaxID=572307 RepID=F0VLZ4_NEOCL|nr:conserved hypothetical protein [Neospora caninum Liverpool]CBZ54272.1 conserved hypothetical protein [Neospora caninum Liverpool]CEL68977.1 TPA: PDI family protein [Neospora caninum Liverpool]|eukprot:XP_003884303.1 conserved hypothetical protein [Neospora caninum Liverpool]
MTADVCAFDTSVVKRALHGNYVPVGLEHFAGVSVALFFAKSKHSKCAQIFPTLRQFYDTTNASGEKQAVEIIFVSLDKDEQEFERFRSLMPWCSVEFNSPLRKNLLKRYRVADDEIVVGEIRIPAAGLPLLVVIGPNGEEAGRLSFQPRDESGFQQWDYRFNKWPGSAHRMSVSHVAAEASHKQLPQNA